MGESGLRRPAVAELVLLLGVLLPLLLPLLVLVVLVPNRFGVVRSNLSSNHKLSFSVSLSSGNSGVLEAGGSLYGTTNSRRGLGEEAEGVVGPLNGTELETSE